MTKKSLAAIPAYSDYKQNFNKCDVWPFKRGGRGISGEDRAHHDFIAQAASILNNTINAWKHLNKLDISYGEFYKRLADQLFIYSFQYADK